MSVDVRPPVRSDPLRPRRLTVLYDPACPVCCRARRWAASRPQVVPLRFVAAGSSEAARLFPDLDAARTLTEITVVTDSGAVLTGEKAWIAVLWALAPTRRAALAIASGRRRFSFHALKGATETMRRLSGAGRVAVGPMLPRVAASALPRVAGSALPRVAGSALPRVAGSALPPPHMPPPFVCAGCADDATPAQPMTRKR